MHKKPACALLRDYITENAGIIITYTQDELLFCSDGWQVQIITSTYDEYIERNFMKSMLKEQIKPTRLSIRILYDDINRSYIYHTVQDGSSVMIGYTDIITNEYTKYDVHNLSTEEEFSTELLLIRNAIKLYDIKRIQTVSEILEVTEKYFEVIISTSTKESSPNDVIDFVLEYLETIHERIQYYNILREGI